MLTCVKICQATIIIFTDCKGRRRRKRAKTPRSAPTFAEMTYLITRAVVTTAAAIQHFTAAEVTPRTFSEHFVQVNLDP